MNWQERTAETPDRLQAAISRLEALLKEKRGPTRHDARELLIALGEMLGAGPEAEIEDGVEAVARITSSDSTFAAAWRAAVADELSLACTEHVRSVDPRYLELPRYDFEYTLAARERLEHRLRAAERLGLPATTAWLEQVARADRLLAERLERRPGRERNGR